MQRKSVDTNVYSRECSSFKWVNIKRIQSLQDITRAMLIHQNIRWDIPATINLWLYTLRMANDAIHKSPNLCNYEGQSNLQIFSNVDV